MNRLPLSIFLEFRKLILDHLEQSESVQPQLSLQLIELKKQVVDSVFSISLGAGKNASIKRQLQQLQRDLILLSNQLFITNEGKDSNEFTTLAHTSVIEILQNLNLHNANYFDISQPIPFYLATETTSKLAHKIPVLQARLKRSKITSELQELVLNPFFSFSTNANNSYTNRRYVLEYIDQLISQLNENSGQEQLFYIMLYAGFNAPSFTRYYIQKISENVKGNHSINCQLETLYEYESMLNGIPKKLQSCYDDNHPNTRATALKYIKAEINCLLKKRQLSITNEEVAGSADYRIKTSLSVEGLAYLLRLLVEAEVIEASPRTQLMNFMAANVLTKGKDKGTISAQSLYTKYKQVNQYTAGSIRSLLLQMAKQAQHSFDL